MTEEKICLCEMPWDFVVKFDRSFWYVPEKGTPIRFQVKFCPVCGKEIFGEDGFWPGRKKKIAPELTARPPPKGKI